MSHQTEIINSDTVISIENGSPILISQPTFKASEFIEELSTKFPYDSIEKVEKWFQNGAECQILVPGKPWQKGKIRVCLEFIPDEVDSPLDDIRQAIADDNQPV